MRLKVQVLGERRGVERFVQALVLVRAHDSAPCQHGLLYTVSSVIVNNCDSNQRSVMMVFELMDQAHGLIWMTTGHNLVDSRAQKPLFLARLMLMLCCRLMGLVLIL